MALRIYIIAVIPPDIWQVVNLHILKWCSENNSRKNTHIRAGQRKVNHAITKTHMENVCMARGWKIPGRLFKTLGIKFQKSFLILAFLASGDLLINVLLGLFGYVCMRWSSNALEQYGIKRFRRICTLKVKCVIFSVLKYSLLSVCNVQRQLWVSHS